MDRHEIGYVFQRHKDTTTLTVIVVQKHGTGQRDGTAGWVGSGVDGAARERVGGGRQGTNRELTGDQDRQGTNRSGQAAGNRGYGKNWFVLAG